MNSTELETARTEAQSFLGKIPPNEAVYVGHEIREHIHTVFIYYRDKAGQYYYKSKRI